jgi:hypothetical protein
MQFIEEMVFRLLHWDKCARQKRWFKRLDQVAKKKIGNKNERNNRYTTS